MSGRTRCLRWVFAALVAIAAGSIARPAHAQMDNAAQAQLHFNRGRDAFVRHEYEPALTEFRAAIALVGSPNTRLYIARCLHEMGHNAEAFFEYQRAAAEAADRMATEPRYAATRETARTEGASVQALLGNLVVRVPNAPAGVNVLVDGAAMPSSTYGVPTPFDPRDVEIRATAPGRVAFVQHVHVQAGQDAEVVVQLQVDTSASHAAVTNAAPVVHRVRVGGGVRMAGFVVAAVGVAEEIAAGVLYGMSVSRFNDLNSMHCCSNPNDPRIDEGQNWERMSYVFAIAGGVVLVAGVVMVAAGGSHEVVRTETPGATAHARNDRPRWAPWIAPASGGAGGAVGIVGEF